MTENKTRILLVDDESALVMIGAKVLDRLGYSVAGFCSAREALEAFKKASVDFDIVISDLTMPGMTGIDLAGALVEIRPDIPILLVSGYVEESIRAKAARLGVREILNKPVSAKVMAEAVQRALMK